MDYGYDTTTPAEGETLDKGAFMRKVARQSILLARQVCALARCFELGRLTSMDL